MAKPKKESASSLDPKSSLEVAKHGIESLPVADVKAAIKGAETYKQALETISRSFDVRSVQGQAVRALVDDLRTAGTLFSEIQGSKDDVRMFEEKIGLYKLQLHMIREALAIVVEWDKKTGGSVDELKAAIDAKKQEYMAKIDDYLASTPDTLAPSTPDTTSSGDAKIESDGKNVSIDGVRIVAGAILEMNYLDDDTGVLTRGTFTVRKVQKGKIFFEEGGPAAEVHELTDAKARIVVSSPDTTASPAAAATTPDTGAGASIDTDEKSFDGFGLAPRVGEVFWRIHPKGNFQFEVVGVNPKTKGIIVRDVDHPDSTHEYSVKEWNRNVDESRKWITRELPLPDDASAARADDTATSRPDTVDTKSRLRIVDDKAALAAFEGEPKVKDTLTRTPKKGLPYTVVVKGINIDSDTIVLERLGTSDREELTLKQWNSLRTKGEITSMAKKTPDVVPAPDKKPATPAVDTAAKPVADAPIPDVKEPKADAPAVDTDDAKKGKKSKDAISDTPDTKAGGKKEEEKKSPVVVFAGKRFVIGDSYRVGKDAAPAKRYEIAGVSDDGAQLRVKALDMGGAVLTFDADKWTSYTVTPEKVAPISFLGKTFDVGKRFRWVDKDKRVTIVQIDGLSDDGKLILKTDAGKEIRWDEAALQQYLAEQHTEGATLEEQGILEDASDASKKAKKPKETPSSISPEMESLLGIANVPDAKKEKKSEMPFLLDGEPLQKGEMIIIAKAGGARGMFMVEGLQADPDGPRLVLRHVESNGVQKISLEKWNENIAGGVYTIERRKQGMHELKELFSSKDINDLYSSLTGDHDERVVEQKFKNIFDTWNEGQRALFEQKVKAAGFRSFDHFVQSWKSELYAIVKESMQGMASEALVRQTNRDEHLVNYDDQQELKGKTYGVIDRIKKNIPMLMVSGGAAAAAGAAATLLAAPAVLIGAAAVGVGSLARRLFKKRGVDSAREERQYELNDAVERQQQRFAETEGKFGADRFAATLSSLLDAHKNADLSSPDFGAKELYGRSLDTLLSNESSKEKQLEYRLEKVVLSVGRRNAERYPFAYDTSSLTRKDKPKIPERLVGSLKGILSGDLYLDSDSKLKQWAGHIFTLAGGAAVGASIAYSSGFWATKLAARFGTGALRRGVESYVSQGELPEQRQQEMIMNLERSLVSGKINDRKIADLNKQLTTLEKGSPELAFMKRLMVAMKEGAKSGVFTAGIGVLYDGARSGLKSTLFPNIGLDELRREWAETSNESPAAGAEPFYERGGAIPTGAYPTFDTDTSPTLDEAPTGNDPVLTADVNDTLDVSPAAEQKGMARLLETTLAGEDAKGKNVLHLANELQRDPELKQLIIDRERVAHPEYGKLNDNQVLHRWRVGLAKEAGWDFNTRTFTKTPLFEVKGEQIAFHTYLKDDGTIGIKPDDQFVDEHGAKAFPTVTSSVVETESAVVDESVPQQQPIPGFVGKAFDGKTWQFSENDLDKQGRPIQGAVGMRMEDGKPIYQQWNDTQPIMVGGKPVGYGGWAPIGRVDGARMIAETAGAQKGNFDIQTFVNAKEHFGLTDGQLRQMENVGYVETNDGGLFVRDSRGGIVLVGKDGSQQMTPVRPYTPQHEYHAVAQSEAATAVAEKTAIPEQPQPEAPVVSEQEVGGIKTLADTQRYLQSEAAFKRFSDQERITMQNYQTVLEYRSNLYEGDRLKSFIEDKFNVDLDDSKEATRFGRYLEELQQAQKNATATFTQSLENPNQPAFTTQARVRPYLRGLGPEDIGAMNGGVDLRTSPKIMEQLEQLEEKALRDSLKIPLRESRIDRANDTVQRLTAV